METAESLRKPESFSVRIMTWLALPFVLAWMTTCTLAEAVAALVRRAGEALRITLSTMADGLRRILDRVVLLLRAVARVLLGPVRRAWAVARRLGTRVVVVLRTLARVVGILVIALSRATSIAEDLVERGATFLASTARQAAAMVRAVVAPLRAVLERAASQAASAIRQAAAALQPSLRTSLHRAAALVRHSSAALNLATRRAGAIIRAALRSAGNPRSPVLGSVPRRDKRSGRTPRGKPPRRDGSHRVAASRRMRSGEVPLRGSASSIRRRSPRR